MQLTGNNFAQTITGDAGANQISGGGAVDTLIGGAGGDTFDSGTGSDIILGGTTASDDPNTTIDTAGYKTRLYEYATGSKMNMKSTATEDDVKNEIKAFAAIVKDLAKDVENAG